MQVIQVDKSHEKSRLYTRIFAKLIALVTIYAQLNYTRIESVYGALQAPVLLGFFRKAPRSLIELYDGSWSQSIPASVARIYYFREIRERFPDYSGTAESSSIRASGSRRRS